MNRLLSQNLWPTISKLAKKSVKRAAIAYVSNDEFIKFGDGDLLVCDASPTAIKSAQTDARVLKRAFDRGAVVYSLAGLHAKIILLDEKALIGSANASAGSATNLIEAALMTDQPSVVAMAQALVLQLASQATPLTEKSLNRLLQIEVVRDSARNGSQRPRLKTRDEQYRTWLVGTMEVADDFPEDQDAVEAAAENCRQALSNPRSSVKWMRWTGRTGFHERCSVGDWLIEMHWPLGKRTPEIYQRMPVIERQVFGAATYFYLESFPRAQDQAKGWTDFKKIAARAGIRRKIKPESQFEITESQADALQVLWMEK